MFIIVKRVPGGTQTQALERYEDDREMEARREVSRLRLRDREAVYAMVRVPERREIEV